MAFKLGVTSMDQWDGLTMPKCVATDMLPGWKTDAQNDVPGDSVRVLNVPNYPLSAAEQDLATLTSGGGVRMSRIGSQARRLSDTVSWMAVEK